MTQTSTYARMRVCDCGTIISRSTPKPLAPGQDSIPSKSVYDSLGRREKATPEETANAHVIPKGCHDCQAAIYVSDLKAHPPKGNLDREQTIVRLVNEVKALESYWSGDRPETMKRAVALARKLIPDHPVDECDLVVDRIMGVDYGMSGKDETVVTYLLKTFDGRHIVTSQEIYNAAKPGKSNLIDLLEVAKQSEVLQTAVDVLTKNEPRRLGEPGDPIASKAAHTIEVPVPPGLRAMLNEEMLKRPFEKKFEFPEGHPQENICNEPVAVYGKERPSLRCTREKHDTDVSHKFDHRRRFELDEASKTWEMGRYKRDYDRRLIERQTKNIKGNLVSDGGGLYIENVNGVRMFLVSIPDAGESEEDIKMPLSELLEWLAENEREAFRTALVSTSGAESNDE